MVNPEEVFWKRKLIAYLHDPPDKCFDIRGHEDSAKSFMSGAGFGDESELDRLLSQIKDADHFSSSAERFVFPKGKCATEYDAQTGSSFIHPLSSSPYIASKNLKAQAGNLHGVLKSAVGSIDTTDWRVKFFLYWRRWMENAVTNSAENSEHLAFSPADSRIPDHSIWNHMSVTSALAGCTDDGKVKPALLLFQLGPVQDFISQSRSTRDLWSGSYLLSWLIAHAMKAITDQVGPDSIIFPNLRGNGIFDALHKDEIYGARWKDRNGSTMTTWERMKDEKRKAQEKGEDRVADWLLTPTLPNRFLALVPGSRVEELAKSAENSIKKELEIIGQTVWDWISKEAGKAGCVGIDNWKKRWDLQIKAFPQITWAVQAWLEREKCFEEFAKLPVNDKEKKETPLQRLKDMFKFAEDWLPVEDRDPRYYLDSDKSDPKKGKTKLKNPGILWSAHYALVDAKLAARRNTRDFSAWEKEERKEDGKRENGTPKDSLSGKEEVIGDEKFWKFLIETYGKDNGNLFTSSGHRYGAMNLIKRLWCRSDKTPYLREKSGLTEKEFNSAVRFETVEDVAEKNKYGGKYVAILAMDGDDMGKWVSGEKTPEFLRQVSDKARQYLEPILEKHGKKDLKRMLTPSYHLQFSEALANYSTWLASVIVDEFDGQLIYSGGDDVLAMLPADRAIECAEALRAVFQGQEPAGHSKFKLAVTHSGFVMERAGYPLIVPGKAADVSIGLAIGHCNAPLQMLVKEAHKAEKRAKKEYKKGAIAITVYKRSGEILEWGGKWDDEDGKVALRLMKKMTEWSSGDDAPVSGRFPYALAELLSPYELGGERSIDDGKLKDIILKEFAHVVQQQAKNLEEKAELLELAEKWLAQTEGRYEDFAKLFLVETFINRARGEN